MAFRARKVPGAFEKRAPGRIMPGNFYFYLFIYGFVQVQVLNNRT